MKKTVLILLLFSATVATAQSKDETKIAAAVEAFNNALIAGDSNALKKLTANELSYGHSSGRIENRQTFVDSAVQGQLKFVSIVASNQTIKVARHAAIVRHLFVAKANTNGTPADIKLNVLQVWQKRGGTWKLLARQAVRA